MAKLTALGAVKELLDVFERDVLLQQNNQQKILVCICGGNLTKISDATALYNGSGAQCDICNNIGNRKASILFNSKHCKSTYRPFDDDYYLQRHIGIEHLLSMMIYCNYTNLQYQFSKTYRENKGVNHNNFYWME
eukprot:361351_1